MTTKRLNEDKQQMDEMNRKVDYLTKRMDAMNMSEIKKQFIKVDYSLQMLKKKHQEKENLSTSQHLEDEVKQIKSDIKEMKESVNTLTRTCGEILNNSMGNMDFDPSELPILSN